MSMAAPNKKSKTGSSFTPPALLIEGNSPEFYPTKPSTPKL
jgi:hypothetical protein